MLTHPSKGTLRSTNDNTPWHHIRIFHKKRATAMMSRQASRRSWANTQPARAPSKGILRRATDPDESSQGVGSSAGRPRRFADTCPPGMRRKTEKVSMEYLGDTSKLKVTPSHPIDADKEGASDSFCGKTVWTSITTRSPHFH